MSNRWVNSSSLAVLVCAFTCFLFTLLTIFIKVNLVLFYFLQGNRQNTSQFNEEQDLDDSFSNKEVGFVTFI